MSILQRQVIQSLNGLSDDNLRFLLEMIQRFMKPSEEKKRKMLEPRHNDPFDRIMVAQAKAENFTFLTYGSYAVGILVWSQMLTL